MSRVVLDISTLYRWTTRDVGITRTERMLARRLLSRNDSMFVRYDPAALTYVEVPRSAVEHIAYAAAAVAVGGEIDAAVLMARTGLKGLKGNARRAAKHAAVRAERLIPPPARADYWAGLRHLRLAATRSMHGARPAASAQARVMATPADLRAGDVYISVGLDWDSNSYSHLYALKRRIGFKVLLTCYDLIPVMFPQYLGSDEAFYGKHFVDLVHTADAVTCISETSRRDLLAFAAREGLPCPPAIVNLLGADFSPAPAMDGEPQPTGKPLMDGDFVLMVGTIEPRKNHRLAFDVWERMVQDRGPERTPTLVVVGRRGWRTDDLVLAFSLNRTLADVVVLKHDVSDAELAWLYENCLFTMLPSLYEGWGLPVVESIAHGKLCVASTAPAVVEAGYGVAVHLDPFDQRAWLDTLTRLIDDPAALAAHEAVIDTMRTSLPQRLSWDRYADELLSLATGLGAD